MDRESLAPRIDHTVLGPETTPADVARVCEEADRHGMNVCVPPCYVAEARAAFDGTLATVVGFPHGQHAPDVKCREAVRAWEDGADELDVVTNVGRVLAGDDAALGRELERVVAATPLPVKAIVEAPLLDEPDLRRVCAQAVDAGAAMGKTATGFAGGATVPDVEVMAEYLPVKASGGIGTYEETAALLDAGAERIGASSGVAILRGAPE
ncbi:MAG: deoxyribose-phosphate aldolase [Haloarculaceae archaeon]